MEKEVLIHVRGLQMMETDDRQEPIEIVVPGQYYFRNGSHYLRYEEMLDDSAEPTVNYIKMSPNGVEVRKKGLVNVHMVFEKNKKNVTYYHTPYGSLLIGIDAYRVDIAEEEDEIIVEVEYELEINNEHVADCHIRLKANPQRSTEFHIL